MTSKSTEATTPEKTTLLAARPRETTPKAALTKAKPVSAGGTRGPSTGTATREAHSSRGSRDITCVESHVGHNEAELGCQGGNVISHVSFASYGQSAPGPCAELSVSTKCHSLSSERVVNERCLGKPSCQIKSDHAIFGDPCPGAAKWLLIRYECAKEVYHPPTLPPSALQQFAAALPTKPQALARGEIKAAVASGRVLWMYYQTSHWSSPYNAMVSLNIASWRKALPSWPIVVVNDTNVKEFVPDMPPEFWRMPYTQVKSDLMRAAVLHRHGGLYLDTDFILTPEVAKAVKLLDAGYEVITYGVGSEGQGVCSHTKVGDFASNFM